MVKSAAAESAKIVKTSKKDGRGKKTGGKKYGGRQKGTPNKNTMFLHKILAESGVNVGDEIKTALVTADMEQRIRIIDMILNHFPKPTAVEFKPESSQIPLTDKEKAAKLVGI